MNFYFLTLFYLAVESSHIYQLDDSVEPFLSKFPRQLKNGVKEDTSDGYKPWKIMFRFLNPFYELNA